MRPIHTLAALAAASCLAGTAQAQQVQMYGTIDVGVGQIETQPPGPPTAAIVTSRGVHSGSLQTSYFGIRGSEDLGDGLRARFQVESFIRVDTGQNGRFDASPSGGADAFWSRESFVALGGSFGEVRLGVNVHPTWIALIQTSAMGSNSVFSPGFRQLFNGGARGKSEVDTAMVNSVKYVSPVVAGVEGSIAVQAGEGSGTGASYSGNIGYRSGPLLVAVGFSKLNHAAIPNLPGVRDQQIALVGGAYDFGVVRLFGQYVAVDNDRLKTEEKVTHLGLTAPIGLGVFQLAWAEDKTTGTTPAASVKRTTTSVGYVYSMSKRTQLYGFGMTDKLPVVGNADSYVLGIRHTF